MPSRRLLAAGVAGNASIVMTWALSRTTGLPFGPEAWTAEPATPLDVAATAFELGIVDAGGLLFAARAPYRKASGGKVTRVAAIGALAVAGLTCAAFAGTDGGTAGHHRPGPAEHAVSEPHAESTVGTQGGVRPRAGETRAAEPASARRTARPAKPARGQTAARLEANAAPHEHPTPQPGG